MKEQLGLTALLSQVLVAFTIELDNEFEHAMPHRTTMDRSGRGPWLTSAAMYFNCLRYLREDGISVGDLHELAGTTTNLDGMRRWLYISLSRNPEGPANNFILTPTGWGRKAARVWEPLFGAVETRWERRFGASYFDLRGALDAKVGRRYDLPDCMPILGYGLMTKDNLIPRMRPSDDAPPSLPELLARMLVLIAIEFEERSKVSLAISANVLRVLGQQGVPVKDLPKLSGASKEAIAMATGWLERGGLAIEERLEATKPLKVVKLTDKGLDAKQSYLHLIKGIERSFETVGLSQSLEQVVVENRERLFEGMKPYPENWRAKFAAPQTLPHFPMVLHRGGYPDGS
jgi:hypothetical protein